MSIERNIDPMDTELTIEQYADILRSYMGTSYINEWGKYMAGPRFPQPVVCFNTAITRDSIKHLVDALGDTNPLFRDEKYAKNTKYGTLIAPPCWPFTIVYGHYPPFAIEKFRTLYAGDSIEWFLPAADGDEIDWITTFPTDVTIKETRGGGGKTIFCQGTHEFRRHQGGAPLARQRFTTIYLQTKFSKYGTTQTNDQMPVYEEEYIKKIYEAQDNEKVWGSTPHYFEDVEVGEELPPIARGPITVMENAAWIHAASQYFFCSDKLHRYIHETTGWGDYDPDLKIWLNFHENFYDAYGVQRKRTGSYAAGMFGSHRLGWATMMLSNWASDEGFVWKLDIRHTGKASNWNCYWTRGKVSAKHCENNRCWVDIDLYTEDQDGNVCMKGTASVILPSREHGNVIYPAPEKAFKSFSIE